MGDVAWGGGGNRGRGGGCRDDARRGVKERTTVCTGRPSVSLSASVERQLKWSRQRPSRPRRRTRQAAVAASRRDEYELQDFVSHRVREFKLRSRSRGGEHACLGVIGDKPILQSIATSGSPETPPPRHFGARRGQAESEVLSCHPLLVYEFCEQGGRQKHGKSAAQGERQDIVGCSPFSFINE